jgi:4-hydroxy 2-oxovalerate aldolase
MGRGAGNLKMELLLTYLESQNKISLDFNKLSTVVGDFEVLRKEHDWGTNLPYMFSGAHSLPQKDVMDWVGMNRYSLSSILNALNNQKLVVEDNIKLPVLDKTKSFKTAVILGGGKSVETNKEAIVKYAESKNDFCLIHAGIKNILNFKNVNCQQIYSLVGVENEKVLEQIHFEKEKNTVFVLPPYPRKMGVSLPQNVQLNAKELLEIVFTNSSLDSPFVVAIQTALDLGVNELLLVGFDGYDTEMNKNQFSLAQENQNIINDLIKIEGIKLSTLNPTKYEHIEITSIYSLI